MAMGSNVVSQFKNKVFSLTDNSAELLLVKNFVCENSRLKDNILSVEGNISLVTQGESASLVHSSASLG